MQKNGPQASELGDVRSCDQAELAMRLLDLLAPRHPSFFLCFLIWSDLDQTGRDFKANSAGRALRPRWHFGRSLVFAKRASMKKATCNVGPPKDLVQVCPNSVNSGPSKLAEFVSSGELVCVPTTRSGGARARCVAAAAREGGRHKASAATMA